VPEDADTHRHLARLQAAQGVLPLALRSARRACELAPDDPRSWSGLGRVYAMEGKLKDAVQCFCEAIRVDARFTDG
jgi:Flp pilus assembly protein TadD